MKYTITRVISILLVLTICLSCVPMEAFAWGKMTHVYTANLMEDEVFDGSVTLRYNVNSEDEVQSFQYDIPQEFLDAIRSYPDAFRAGALGPDVYPDILTGQLYIHPEDVLNKEDYKYNPDEFDVDSGMWITSLCNAVNKMSEGTEDRKMCLSFTLGCILHYCGDLFGHDFVNTFAGGDFPSFFSSEIFNVRGERLNNILSHLSVESYMDEQIYANYNVKTEGSIDAPDEFVSASLIFNDTPAGGLNSIYEGYPTTITANLDELKAAVADIWLIGGTLESIVEGLFDEQGNNVPPHYTAMLNLRDFLTSTADEYREHMDPISAAVTAFCDAWTEDVDEGTVELTATCDRIARRIVTGEKNPEIEKKTEAERLEDHNRVLLQFGYDVDAENLKYLISLYGADIRMLEKFHEVGIYGDSFFDIVLAELVLKDMISLDMLKSENSSIMIIKEELNHWLDEHGVYMTFIPDIFIDGIEVPYVGSLMDPITDFLKAPLQPIFEWIKGAIKDLFADWIISVCTGVVADFSGWEEEDVVKNLTQIVAKIVARIDDPEVQLDHEDNPYKPFEDNFAELEGYMTTLEEEREYSILDSEMESLYNTLTMFQLVLMGPENYSKFVKQYAGVDQTSYQTNTASPEVTSLKVSITTSDLYLAGTNDNIYMVVYRMNANGSKDEIKCKLLDVAYHDDFEYGETQTYTVELPESVKLSQLEIALKKTPAYDFTPGITDDWRCENIRVTPMYAGYVLSAPVDLGGIHMQGICDPMKMNFQTALYARTPEDSKSQTVTNLRVQIKVKDELYAGTDSNIYLKVYNNGSLWQSVLLDKAVYNDLEQGDNDTYNIPIVRPGKVVQGIPLNRLTVKFDHTGSDESDWENVSFTPCYGTIQETNALSVGGKTLEKAVWKPNFQQALKKATYRRQEPLLNQTVTSLDVRINVANELGAGTDDDIYLYIYSGDSTEPVQKELLDKEDYNDFEQNDSDVYTVVLSNKAAKIPLDQMRLAFRRKKREEKYNADGTKNKNYYVDDAIWNEVLVTAYNGSKALTDPVSLGGTEFKDDLWDTKFQSNLKMHYTPVVLEYTTNIDDGLLSYLGSLDGGEEWVNNNNELWANTTLRTEVFFEIFKGFTPEIEYAGSASIQKGKPAEIKLNFTGMWNGVSNDRRSQVKDFEHVYAVAGTVDIEFIDESGKSVLKTTSVKVADNKANITIPYNENMALGSYDIKVTYHPDKANPAYAGTEAMFEDALLVTVPDSCVVRIKTSPEEGGGVMGSGTYKYEETCTVSAHPNAGYEFVEWRNDTGVVSRSTSYTFTVVDNCDLVAVFKEISSEFTSVINNGKERVELSMGEVHSLYAKIEGGTAPYTYEWQYLEPGKTTWKRGTSQESFGLIGDDVSNGRRYRVQVTDANGKKSISNEVIAVVQGGKFAVQINDGAPEIVFETNENSPSQKLTANIIGGIGPYTYKWYLDNSGSWEQVSTSSTYTITACEDNQGAKIKVEVTDSTGKQITSEEVTVNIKNIVVN